MPDADGIDRPITRFAGRIAGLAGGWLALATLFSALAQGAAALRGAAQPWWPSLAYTIAVFSIWALMTPAIVVAVRRIERAGLAVWRRIALYVAGLPFAMLAHVALFTLIWWPVYGAGQSGGLDEMARRVALANYDTDVLLYVLMVALCPRLERRVAPPDAPRTDAVAPLAVRVRGAIRLLPIESVDWVGAAGNYCEVHCGVETHLLDEPLGTLAARLPAAQFARVHRSCLVRVERIAEIRSLGRGDAALRLRDGTELRLSRRYRAAFNGRLVPLASAAVPLDRPALAP